MVCELKTHTLSGEIEHITDFRILSRNFGVCSLLFEYFRGVRALRDMGSGLHLCCGVGAGIVYVTFIAGFCSCGSE